MWFDSRDFQKPAIAALAAMLLSLRWPVASASAAEAEGFFASLTESHQGLLCFTGWVAAAAVAALLIFALWNGVFLRLAARTKTDLDVAILRSTRLPAMLLVFLAIVKTGSELTLAPLESLICHPGWPIWQGFLYVGLVLAATLLVLASIRAVAEWYSHRRLAAGPAVGRSRFGLIATRVAKFALFFVALTIIFEHFNIQITGLLATAGVVSLAVAFAAQETLANMIAGFVLIVDRPFKVGDRIQLADGQMGDVLDIGLRRTDVLSFDNTVISLPNAEIAKGRVINYSAPDAKFKIRATIGVAYGTDLRKVKAILTGVMTSHQEVLKDPAPVVYFTEFADSALNLLLVCWVADYREQFRIRDELFMAIKDRFETEGVSIPFPQRDVHVFAAGHDPGPPRLPDAQAGSGASGIGRSD
jgi:small-conductance mechanosensitive channel